MVNLVALIVISVMVGFLRPHYQGEITWGRRGNKGRAQFYIPIFAVTLITAIRGGRTGTAFLAELAGWALAYCFVCRKQKKQ